MKSMKMYRHFDQLNPNLQRKVAFKYLQNPESAVFRAPSDDGELVDVIEIWDNDAYHYVIVTKENQRDIYWREYLDSNDEDIFLPFHDLDSSYDIDEDWTSI